MTGTDAEVMAIAGFVLLAIGGSLLWLSRRREEVYGLGRPTVADSQDPGSGA